MAIAFTGTATIDTTPYSLPNASTTLTARTDQKTIQAFIDFSNVVAGVDKYKWEILEKVISGGTARSIVSGYVETPRTVVTPSLVLEIGWDVRVTKISGTNRSISWTLRAPGA